MILVLSKIAAELMMIVGMTVDYRMITDCQYDFLIYQHLFIFEVFSSSTNLLQITYLKHLFHSSMPKSYLHLEFTLKIDLHPP